MRDAKKLRSLFPRASESFFKANETETGSQLQSTESKCKPPPTLDSYIQRTKKSGSRITLRYHFFRVRPQDPDNAAASTKQLTDLICCCGLIPGDDPTQIKLEIEQDRVAHYAQERTEIYIIWPE